MKKKTLALLLVCAAALAACGKPDNSTPTATAPATAPATTLPAPPPVVPAVAPPVPPEHVQGKGVFDKVCALCHGAGVAGAPRPGDKANWGPRIAQGTPLLYKHALEGFIGPQGVMPARGGGGASLNDADIKAAVDYMVFLSR